MSEHDGVNYPDILGAITRGTRLNIDVIQCALAVRPAQVAAGQFMEMVFVIQNASDIDVDVTVRPDLPTKDIQNKKARFSTKSTRVVVGLRPAEVGFLALPVATPPTAAPGAGYAIGLDLEIKRMDKRPQRVRETTGGGHFMVQELPKDTQTHLENLRALAYSADHGSKKNYIQVPFEIHPPALASLKELKPDWISLWTMRDHVDEYIIAQKVWDPAMSVVSQLRRELVFMPLLKTTQERFQKCSYPLLPPEVIYITKLFTLILEMGVIEPGPATPRPAWPRWFARMCRLLFQEPALKSQVEPLVTRLLYADLMYDAIQYAFTMVSTVTNERFGTPEETQQYAQGIVDAVLDEHPMDFARAYFPMVLGGLIANTRVTMPREQVRETVFTLSKAVDNRRKEKNADNTFVFDIADLLIERALDMSG